MNNFAVIYELARQLGLIDLFFDIYGRYIWTAGLIIALLNCFFGYKLRKLWSVLIGFLLGVSAGAGICIYLRQPAPISLAVALIAGAICALLAFLLYRVGLFLLCAGLTAFTLWQLLPLHTNTALIVYIIIGIVIGILALVKERITVSLATAVGGGWAGAWFLSLLTGMDSNIFVILMTIIFAALGILLQLKPWKGREYWQPEDKQARLERKEEKKRRARRRKAKRKNAKKNKKEKKKEKERQKKRELQKERPKQQRPEKAPVDNAAPISQTPAAQQNPDAGYNIPAADSYPGPNNSSGAAAGNIPDSHLQTPEKSPLDLSDVRSQLSQEVSEIFREQNQDDES